MTVDVIAALAQAPRNLVDELDRSLSVLEQAEASGMPLFVVVPSQRTATGAITSPYARYDAAVHQATDVIGRITHVGPSAGDRPPTDGPHYDPAQLAELPLEEVVWRLMFAKRSERFTEGALAGPLESGWFVAAVRRIRQAMPAGR